MLRSFPLQTQTIFDENRKKMCGKANKGKVEKEKCERKCFLLLIASAREAPTKLQWRERKIVQRERREENVDERRIETFSTRSTQ